MFTLRSDSPNLAGLKIGAQLFARLSAEVERKLKKGLGKKNERRVISHLSLVPDSTDSEIVKALGLHPSQGSALFGELEEQGLIQSKATPRHPLQRLRYLSPLGVSRAEEIRIATSTAINEVLAGFGIEDRVRVMQAMGLTRAGRVRGQVPESVTYRPFLPKDWASVISELAGPNLPRKHGEMRAAFHNVARFADQDLEWEMAWIAHEEDTLVGCCLVALREDLMVADVILCIVSPWARRAGIARSLLNYCAAACSKFGISSLVAMADPNSPFAKALVSSGFAKTNRPKSQELGPEDLHDYVRNLPLLDM